MIFRIGILISKWVRIGIWISKWVSELASEYQNESELASEYQNRFSELASEYQNGIGDWQLVVGYWNNFWTVNLGVFSPSHTHPPQRHRKQASGNFE